MLITIHQPNYLPYLGFFDKMMKSDIFVIYDDAQFNKEDFQHRNKIKIYHGWKWLTVPVEKKCIHINKIKIKDELISWKGAKWSESHFKDIRDNYKNTPFYESYENEIKKIYNKKFINLIDLNMAFIEFIKKSFAINTKIIFSSELVKSEKVNPISRSSERLIEIVKALEGDEYLSGVMGHEYLDLPLFKRKGIKVKFQEFKHPVYIQHYDGFIPNLSAIDALLNIGKIEL